MIWQKLTVTVLLILNFNSQAGGVDVGNGGLTLEYKILIDEGFNSEEALTDFLQENTLNIETGSLYNLSILRSQNSCSKRIELKEMEVEKIYPFRNGVIRPREYKGLLKVKLNNCKPKN